MRATVLLPGESVEVEAAVVEGENPPALALWGLGGQARGAVSRRALCACPARSGRPGASRRRRRQAWALTDAERFYGTNFQKEIKALGGRPHYTPLDLGG
jgi:hypothetical protein